jgi:hypothetical protein
LHQQKKIKVFFVQKQKQQQPVVGQIQSTILDSAVQSNKSGADAGGGIATERE